MTRSNRLNALLHYLGGRRSRSLAEIRDRFGVSERTVYRDLASLQEQYYPIEKDDHGYRLAETAHLQPLNFTSAELSALELALDNPVLRRQPALAPLLRSVEDKVAVATRKLEEASSALELAGRDRSGTAAGRALPPLEEAALDHRTVRIHYHSLSGGTTAWRRVDPWRIFQRGDAWYLIGHCHQHDGPRIFRLDRITGVEPTADRFDPPEDFDLHRLLAGSWGMLVGDAEHTIVLRFDPTLEPLFRHARHHPGETIEELEDGTFRYRVRLGTLEEIARWIVGFGGRVRVEEPEALQELGLEIARGAVKGLEEG